MTIIVKYAGLSQKFTNVFDIRATNTRLKSTASSVTMLHIFRMGNTGNFKRGVWYQIINVCVCVAFFMNTKIKKNMIRYDYFSFFCFSSPISRNRNQRMCIDIFCSFCPFWSLIINWSLYTFIRNFWIPNKRYVDTLHFLQHINTYRNIN